MATIERHVDVRVPEHTAYERWMQLESFPRFAEDIVEVRELGTNCLRWKASVSGKTAVWDAQIDERIDGKRIAWHSVSGPRNAGCVTFHRLNDGESRIMVQIEWQPDGALERLGDWLGAVDRSVERTLAGFKAFVEGEGPRGALAWTAQAPEARPEIDRTI